MFDYVLKNGLIVDGTGKKPYEGTVCIKDGKIAKIVAGEIAPCEMEGATVLDVEKHVIAPGFLNVHAHSDDSHIAANTYESSLRQGITLECNGQCGLSSVPTKEDVEACGAGERAIYKTTDEQAKHVRPRNMKEYVKDVEACGAAINVTMVCGHGALRSAIVDWEQRPLTEDEMKRMCDLLDRELTDGALGVSFGLIYPPGSFCDTDEIKALAAVCAKHNKFLAVHMRNENRHVFEALDEMFDVAESTGVRLEISHLKVMGKTMWGRSGELLKKVDRARARGIAIHCDQYPYDASSSRLTSSIPNEALDGGWDALVKNIQDDEWWNRISENGTLPELEFRGGAENVIISTYGDNPEMKWIVGKSIAEVAREMGVSVAEGFRRIVIGTKGRCQCIYHNMSMEDVLHILSQRDISVVTDGTAYTLNNYGGRPHPRNAGAFARFFRLNREHNLMPIEDAVYKVTALPATIMGIDDEFGTLEVGKSGTITVFDPETITDNSTYDVPNLPASGVDYVLVNGQLVLDHETITDARPGRCITR